MNPLDIFQKTPKTNCGQCGHPSCLAYAAAVAKMGEEPAKCPFMKEADLALIGPSAGKIDDPAHEKDLALIQHLKTKIASLNFQEIAPGIGAVCPPDDPETMSFGFLGQAARISKSGILIDDREPADPRDQILLYNYVNSGGGKKLSDKWIGLESLPNTISKVRTLAIYGEKPIAELFDQKEKEAVLKTCLNELQAETIAAGSAAIALLFPVLPMVPLQVLFWNSEPEDGFDARVKILFTENVLNYLDLESLVFTAERLSERLHDILNNYYS